METANGRSSRFIRARAVIASLNGISALKLLLALTAQSRPRRKPFALFLLKLLAPGSSISYVYSIAGRSLVGFLRRANMDSDLQSAMELAIGDCYRMNQLPEPDLVIDGGANTGLFTLAAAARWPKARIIAFEPVPANLEAIQSHLAANRFQNPIQIEPLALAASDHKQRFYLREANQGSFTGDIPSTNTLEVNCHALLPYLPTDPNLLKLIKLDIEGAEVEVLDSLFASGGIKKTIIVMELHNTPISRPWVVSLAQRIGYTLEFFEVGSVTAHCQLTSPDLAPAPANQAPG